MRNFLHFFISLMILLVFVSCDRNRENISHRQAEIEGWLEENGRLKVLCSTAMIEDIVAKVGGDRVDTIVLIPGQIDPHSYQLVKGDEEKLAHAELIFYNGLGLEHNPSLRRILEDNSKAVPVGDQISEKNPQEVIYVDGLVDPHIWMDVSLWSQVVDVVLESFKKLDLKDFEDFEARAEKVHQEMQDTHEEILELFSVVPEDKRYLVTSHDAFRYFGRAYLATPDERMSGTWMERTAAPEGLAPESMISATDIQEIIDHIVKYDIHVLFGEWSVNIDSLKKMVNALKEMTWPIRIAEERLYSDTMGGSETGQNTYLLMLRHNAEVIAYQLMVKVEP